MPAVFRPLPWRSNVFGPGRANIIFALSATPEHAPIFISSRKEDGRVFGSRVKAKIMLQPGRKEIIVRESVTPLILSRIGVPHGYFRISVPTWKRAIKRT